MLDDCGRGRDLLLHEEHIIQENLINMKRISILLPCKIGNMEIVKAHQDISILAHVSVRMSLGNALDSPAGIEFLRGHFNCHWVQQKPRID